MRIFVPLGSFLQTERLLNSEIVPLIKFLRQSGQGEMFHSSKFLRQAVYLSGYLFTFSPTNCRLVEGLKAI